MATTNFIQQAIALLQQAIQSAPAAPPPNQTFGPGTLISVTSENPFNSAYEVEFFDTTAQPNVLHTFTFAGPLPNNVVVSAKLTLVVTPPSTPNGYSTLVSAQ